MIGLHFAPGYVFGVSQAMFLGYFLREAASQPVSTYHKHFHALCPKTSMHGYRIRFASCNNPQATSNDTLLSQGHYLSIRSD